MLKIEIKTEPANPIRYGEDDCLFVLNRLTRFAAEPGRERFVALILTEPSHEEWEQGNYCGTETQMFFPTMKEASEYIKKYYEDSTDPLDTLVEIWDRLDLTITIIQAESPDL